jgi:hypothetical protein
MGFFSALFGSKKYDANAVAAIAFPKAIREMASAHYDKSMEYGKTKGWSEDACIESSNIATLAWLTDAVGASKNIPNEELANVLQWEAIPFNRLPRDIAKASLVEYVVWRQYPDKADMKLMMAAMNHLVSRLKQTGEEDELLQGFRSSPTFAWLPWRKLIS